MTIISKDSAVPAIVVLGLMLSCALVGLAACSGKSGDNGAKPAPPAPVVEGRVALQSVPELLRAIGNIEAYATVAVRSRVDGEIARVHFREGDAVRAGQTLFTIDPRPFQAQVELARANLARDTALLENARAQERRYQELLDRHFISKEMYAQMKTNAASAAAVVRADEAALGAARLQLSYSSIASPISGVTGYLQVQGGNLVKASDTGNPPLVMINQVSPIYVSFSVPEQFLPRLRRLMASAKPPAVEALPSKGGGRAEQGVLSFIDNAVDTTTGTIRLKAVFDNQDKNLWPGQFADVTLTLAQQDKALTVPSQAVQTGPEGSYVYVIRADMTVEQRKVGVERTEGAAAVIRDGLRADEKIVLDGQLRLKPGAKVVSRPAP